MSGLAVKLSVAADDLAKARLSLLAMAGRPRPGRSTIRTTYYDTADEALRRRELMLRVRKRGRQFVQTVEMHDHAGGDALARGEWEDPIKTALPDLAAPRSGAQVRGGIAAADLRPLFTIEIERASFVLVPLQGTEIAVAIERGEIRTTDGASEPVHDIALALNRGDGAVLWDVALRLLEIVPCRIDMRTEAERGYRLARGAASKPAVAHDHALALHAAMTLDAALQAAGRRLVTAIVRNEAAALAFLPEGIHQTRVAVRRLRAVLSAVKTMLPQEHYRWANGELKWLAGALGPARNWDVFAGSLLAPVSGALPGEAELKRLEAAVEGRREVAFWRVR
jgi:inorganic triphosphatase YgiF